MSSSLQILISVYGTAGISRLLKAKHPKVCGIEYLVNIQGVSEEDVKELRHRLDRDDFQLFHSTSIGVSKNRNELIEKATSELILFGDDDLDYYAENLPLIIASFNSHPEADLLTFRHDSDVQDQVYPTETFDLRKAPKGYFVTCFDIALRRKRLPEYVRFDERFSIGTRFAQGEEDIFISDIKRANLNARYIPTTICFHPGATTYTRLRYTPEYIFTKGAVFTRVFPYSWPLRMITHAIREYRSVERFNPFKFAFFWSKGALTAILSGASSRPKMGK